MYHRYEHAVRRAITWKADTCESREKDKQPFFWSATANSPKGALLLPRLQVRRPEFDKGHACTWYTR